MNARSRIFYRFSDLSSRLIDRLQLAIFHDLLVPFKRYKYTRHIPQTINSEKDECALVLYSYKLL